MYLPWKPKKMTDEQYKDICVKMAVKQKFMAELNVLVLKWSSDEVQAAIKYVNRKYGRDYL